MTCRPQGCETDAEIYDRLAAQSFDGVEQEMFEIVLTTYAMAVLDGWLLDGTIYRLCVEAGRRVLPSDRERALLHRERDERIGLIGVTVSASLRRFRESALRGGVWRPDRGRSLKSFFLGACIQQFPNEYRRWSRSHRQIPTHSYGLDATVLDGRHPRRDGTDDEVADEVVHRQEMNDMPDKLRVVVEGRRDGRTYAEIGDELGISPRAVERIWTQYRNHRRDGGF